jgi:5-formyltetrahydrofolate cyclo-ligase
MIKGALSGWGYVVLPDEGQLIQRKKRQRAEVLAKRQGLSPAVIAESDRLIQARVLDSEFFALARTLFCFMSIAGEVDTKGIILEALAQGKRVCLPRCEEGGIMEAYEIGSLEDVRPGRYNIPEPGEQCRFVPPEDIELALVPCVSCSRVGERLGYGGGFYDRYLAKRNYPAVLLCREALLLDEIPQGPHDLIMDAVLTESTTYR